MVIMLKDKHTDYCVVGKHLQTTEDYYIIEIAGCIQMFSLRDWEMVNLSIVRTEG